MDNLLDRIAKNEGIHVLKAPCKLSDSLKADMTKAFGCACNYDNEYWIFLRDTLSERDRNAVLAHELGHIFLGHIPDDDELYEKRNDTYKELTTAMFAAAIQALMVYDRCKEGGHG